MSPEGVNVRHTDRIWVGGEWVRAHSGRMIELVSPDTEEVIGAVAEADEEDMNAAVAAARAAFDAGPVERVAAARAHRLPQAHGRAPARAHARKSRAPGPRRWAGSRALPCP